MRSTDRVPLADIGTGHDLIFLDLFYESPVPDIAAASRTVLNAVAGAMPVDAGDACILDLGAVRIAMSQRAADGTGHPAARFTHRFGIDRATGLVLGEGLSLSPQPKSQSQGDRLSVDALRAMMQAALALAQTDTLFALSWSPADSLMSRDYFVQHVEAWLQGGSFPALGLVSLRPTEDGAMESHGLRPLTGFEISIARSAQMVRSDQAKLAIRIIDHTLRESPLADGTTVEVIDFGEVTVEHSQDHQYIYLKK